MKKKIQKHEPRPAARVSIEKEITVEILMSELSNEELIEELSRRLRESEIEVSDLMEEISDEDLIDACKEREYNGTFKEDLIENMEITHEDLLPSMPMPDILKWEAFIENHDRISEQSLRQIIQ